MDKFFIGWSGNKPLADKLAQLIEENTNDHAIVGGGRPEDMFIGEQVLKQIQRCNRAILLVEDNKEGYISQNLMFEWGYLIAKLAHQNIYTCLINKKATDLPSDLSGSWVSEFKVDRSTETDEDIAKKIFEKFKESEDKQTELNYFNLVNDWRSVFHQLKAEKALPDTTLCNYLITGCLAAYYYADYPALRSAVNELSGSGDTAAIIAFTKSYIDVFLKTENMMQPLSEEDFYTLSEDFEMTLNRKRGSDEDIDLLIDILCYDVYGLACTLYLRNTDIDEDMKKEFSDLALELFQKDLELLKKFEDTHKSNKCLVLLIEAYIYNDLAHLYKGPIYDNEKFMHCLEASVEKRNLLYRDFDITYKNPFLSIKLEQEYIIALSEQCAYIENKIQKKLKQNAIKKKLTEWEKDLRSTGSLIERIKANMAKL